MDPTFRRRIESRISKKDKEKQELEAQRKQHLDQAAKLDSQIREIEISIQAYSDVLGIAGVSTAEPTGEGTIRPGTILEATRDVLRRVGHPLHVMEILGELGREKTPAKRNSLAGSLAAYVRRGEVFTREGGNIFGLVEFRTAREPVAAASNEVGEADEEDGETGGQEAGDGEGPVGRSDNGSLHP